MAPAGVVGALCWAVLILLDEAFEELDSIVLGGGVCREWSMGDGREFANANN